MSSNESFDVRALKDIFLSVKDYEKTLLSLTSIFL